MPCVTGKQQYTSRLQATKTAYHMEEIKPGEWFDVYICPECAFYHIGHAPIIIEYRPRPFTYWLLGLPVLKHLGCLFGFHQYRYDDVLEAALITRVTKRNIQPQCEHCGRLQVPGGEALRRE